jgi:hypothetical protein
MMKGEPPHKGADGSNPLSSTRKSTRPGAIGGPLEGLRVRVVVVEEAVDSGLEVRDGAEDAALETALGQDGEKALDGN